MGWDVSHAQMNAANVWKMESEGVRKQMNRMKYFGVTVACWSWRRAYHASRGSCWDGMVSRAKRDARPAQTLQYTPVKDPFSGKLQQVCRALRNKPYSWGLFRHTCGQYGVGGGDGDE